MEAYATIKRHGFVFVIAPSGACVGRISFLSEYYRAEHEAKQPGLFPSLEAAVEYIVAVDERLDRLADGRSEFVEVVA